WIIKGSEGEPVVLSFSQFSARCRKEWVSIRSSDGGEPVLLCGSKLPKPMEFPGGNITVTHHFLPHLFPVSSFLLSYARGVFLLRSAQTGVKILCLRCCSFRFVVPDTGECPLTSFECLGGRCLPLSWRCNGRVECLDEGTALGTDEQGCGAEEEPTESTANTSTQKETADSDGEAEGPTEKEKVEKENGADEVAPATPAPFQWPCGGLLQTFYGTFSPPALRGPALFCVWTLDPQDSRPLRLDLQQLVLGPGDKLTVYSRGNGKGDVLKTITSSSNYKSVQVESTTGLLSLAYETLPGSEGNGFNATFHVGAYCPPWEGRCGGAAGGCYTQEQMCDGKYDCPETGRDEKGCKGCGVDQFVCGPTGQRMSTGAHYGGRPVCYPAKERCNYQLYCSDGSDERDCTVCQPGTFHCDSDRSAHVHARGLPRRRRSSGRPPPSASSSSCLQVRVRELALRRTGGLQGRHGRAQLHRHPAAQGHHRGNRGQPGVRAAAGHRHGLHLQTLLAAHPGIQFVCSNQPPGGGADPAAGPALLWSADCSGHHPASGGFPHRKPQRGEQKGPVMAFFCCCCILETVVHASCCSPDIVSVLERNPPAPPSGPHQLPAPPPPAPLRPPRRAEDEALGPDAQGLLPAQPAAQRRAAAVGGRPLGSAGVPRRPDRLVLGGGGAEPAGAPQAQHAGPAAAAGRGEVFPAATSSAPTRHLHASATLRPPCSTGGHAPCGGPLQRLHPGFHLPHAGLEHLPLPGLPVFLLHQFHGPLCLPVLLLLLLLLL
ncbi:unnamed protein product, partial [Tetraodon nigroviridis]